jgi:nucleoside-diphosphate-sugar epimerase
MIRGAMTGTPARWDGIPGGPPYEEDQDDPLYIKDCARGIQMLAMARNLPSRAYNIGGGRAVTHRELADAVRRVYPDAQIELLPGKPPHGRSYVGMDIGLIKQDIGWEPQYDVYRGVAEWIDWLKDHDE